MPRTEEANQQIREEQRTKILAAAAKVFARKGKAATMADVATETGISQGLAYRYFASKEEILTTLVKQSAQAGGGPAARIREIQGTPGKRLALLVSYLLEDRREHPGFYQFFYQVLADDTMPNDLRQLVQSNGRVIQDIMRQLIIEGQASGEIAKDDSDQLMTALMACFDGLVKRATLLDAENAKKHFPEVKIILRILKPDEQEGKRP
jgi:AcrR family transcriptional regulator